MKVKSESEVAQSCPTLHDPMDCSPSGSSVHGICQARVLEWGAISLWQLATYKCVGMPCLMQMCKYLYNIFFSHIESCYCSVLFSSVQFSCSVTSDSLKHHGLQHARPPCPSSTPRVGVKLMSIESVMLSNHLILCCPLLLLSSIFPSIRVFSNESVLRFR